MEIKRASYCNDLFLAFQNQSCIMFLLMMSTEEQMKYIDPCGGIGQEIDI